MIRLCTFLPQVNDEAAIGMTASRLESEATFWEVLDITIPYTSVDIPTEFSPRGAMSTSCQYL